MTDLEKQIWAASYAAEFARARDWCGKHGMDIDEINGYSCAEIADAAVSAYREAIKSDDAKYLMLVKEGYGVL